MLNVSDIVSDPDFSQLFLIKRSAGSFALGGFQSTVSIVQGYGSIQVAKDEELQQIPEGDRVNGAIKIITVQPIFVTRVQAPEGLSDVINWNGSDWRVYSVAPWQDFGYYRSIAVRMAGD